MWPMSTRQELATRLVSGLLLRLNCRELFTQRFHLLQLLDARSQFAGRGTNKRETRGNLRLKLPATTEPINVPKLNEP